MLEGKGAYYYFKGKAGRSLASINISQDLIKDSNFPFHHCDKLKVSIDVKNKRLIITKMEERE